MYSLSEARWSYCGHKIFGDDETSQTLRSFLKGSQKKPGMGCRAGGVQFMAC
ncbi:hypothetical protein SynA1562_01277 [Synechococcus sp. A15-62]|nr:hypothetical protein SynA1562_01277 [Synechococcus sp. A15-62]